MAEAAITLPVVVLLTFAMVNMAMMGYAAVAASNAANYGARVGSVAQSNQLAYAVAAAQTSLDAIGIGSYQITASGGGFRGAQIIVSIQWTVPNYMGSMISFLGGSGTSTLSGTVQASFRQEGW